MTQLYLVYLLPPQEDKTSELKIVLFSITSYPDIYLESEKSNIYHLHPKENIGIARNHTFTIFVHTQSSFLNQLV